MWRYWLANHDVFANGSGKINSVSLIWGFQAVVLSFFLDSFHRRSGFYSAATLQITLLIIDKVDKVRLLPSSRQNLEHPMPSQIRLSSRRNLEDTILFTRAQKKCCPAIEWSFALSNCVIENARNCKCLQRCVVAQTGRAMREAGRFLTLPSFSAKFRKEMVKSHENSTFAYQERCCRKRT